MATGTGKSLVAIGLAIAASDAGLRVVIRVHLQEIALQFLTAFQIFRPGLKIGMMGLGFRSIEQITIHLVQVQEFIPCDFLIVDEAHHADAPSWEAAAELNRSNDNLREAAFTATPFRSAPRTRFMCQTRMLKTYDVRAYEFGIQDAMRQGWLVPTIIGIEIPTDGFDAEKVVDSYRRYFPHRAALVFPHSVEEATELLDAFTSRGVQSAVVVGDVNRRHERRACIDAYREGGLDVLISPGCLTEGFDVPRAQVAILTRRIWSLPLFIQQIGRITRRWPDKDASFVLDFSKACKRMDVEPAGLEDLATVQRHKYGEYDALKIA